MVRFTDGFPRKSQDSAGDDGVNCGNIAEALLDRIVGDLHFLHIFHGDVEDTSNARMVKGI